MIGFEVQQVRGGAKDHGFPTYLSKKFDEAKL